MAGSYPDAPFRRLAWDADGTILFYASSSATSSWNTAPWDSFTTATLAQRQEINDEDTVQTVITGSFPGNSPAIWIFPQPMDIYGGFCSWGLNSDPVFSGSFAQEYSTDTPNGIAGTWTTWPEVGVFDQRIGLTYSVENSYRSFITSFTPHIGVRAERFIGRQGTAITNNANYAVHWYGEINSSYTADRLLFIDTSTGLEFDGPLDWGDVPRGVTLDYDIDIKNNSSTLTANTVGLSFEALTGTSNTWYTIKETGGSFASTLSITSIAAGVTYPTGADVITIRLAVAGTESFGPQAARLKASVTSWT